MRSVTTYTEKFIERVYPLRLKQSWTELVCGRLTAVNAPLSPGRARYFFYAAKVPKNALKGRGAAPPLRIPTPPALRPRRYFILVGNFESASFRMVMLLESLVLRTKGSYFFVWINVILLTLRSHLITHYEFRIAYAPPSPGRARYFCYAAKVPKNALKGRGRCPSLENPNPARSKTTPILYSGWEL